MDLLSLPPEVITNVCIKMNNRTLLNFVQSSDLAYQICNRVLGERYRQERHEKKSERSKNLLSQRIKLLYPWIKEVFEDLLLGELDEDQPYIYIPLEESDVEKLTNCTIKIVEYYIQNYPTTKEYWQMLTAAAISVSLETLGYQWDPRFDNYLLWIQKRIITDDNLNLLDDYRNVLLKLNLQQICSNGQK